MAADYVVCCRGKTGEKVEKMERTYGLLPVISSSHVYQVGKVRFHVASHFKGKTTIEERLADLMLDEFYDENSEKKEENE